ncbi:hypothetical protein [Nocardia sp. NPDC127526]|uniref:hypothetical protein n=1 Tax=Nocardia sp. NPDC127526 TaxID=3345393 RepID=UPI003635C995
MAGFLLQATAHKNRGEARSGYEMDARFDKNASEVTSSGALSGLGSEAFFVWTQRGFNSGAVPSTQFDTTVLERIVAYNEKACMK